MDSEAHRPTEDELRVFSERIAKRLAERPLDLDPGFHRERVAGLLRQVGEAGFYELLDLPPTSTAQEIHDAYEQIARMVHPVNAPLLGLVGREGVLEMLFERITQAYLNLSQPDRRKAYDRGMSSQVWSAALGPAPSQRREEMRDIADRYYKRALELLAKEELYLAIEVLREAVRISPQADLYALLGKLQAKNPRWLRAATESLQQAMALGSRDPELPAALHDAQERLAAGEWRAANPTTGVSTRASRASKWEDAPDVEVFDPEEEIGGRKG
ncbi:MAG TPA: DnaJ domain-containing protein [Thermoanaerobaculia bacterium]